MPATGRVDDFLKEHNVVPMRVDPIATVNPEGFKRDVVRTANIQSASATILLTRNPNSDDAIAMKMYACGQSGTMVPDGWGNKTETCRGGKIQLLIVYEDLFDSGINPSAVISFLKLGGFNVIYMTASSNLKNADVLEDIIKNFTNYLETNGIRRPFID